MKGKEEASEKMQNEIRASQLPDNEFKALVIRKFNELTENYQNYRETTMNLLQTIPNEKVNRNCQQRPRGNEQHNV